MSKAKRKMVFSDKGAARAGTMLAACAVLMLSDVVAHAAAFQSAKPTVRVEYWQKREADIANMLATSRTLPAVRLVFLGDSITDFWTLGEDPWVRGQWHGASVWAESFGGKDPANLAVNLGISGDRTEHILHRILPAVQGGLGELDAPTLQPDYVFLLAGINNSWAPEDPAVDSIYEGVVALVEAVHARKPRARIVLQSLLPTNNEDKNRDIVRPVNVRLLAFTKDLSRAGWIRFLDLYPAFVDASGKQIVSDFNDGLHPSTAGYRIWRDQLLPFLATDRAKP